MKFVIVTEGTWGDVLPFLYLGKELKQKGHRVVVCTNEFYKDFVQNQELEFIQTTPTLMRERMLSDKVIWRPIRGLLRLPKYIGQIFELAYPIVKKQIDEGDIVISHTFSFAGKVASDVKGVKQISLLISPIQVRTKYQLPIIFGNTNPNMWPSFLRKNFYRIGDLFLLDLLAPSVIYKTLVQEGLPPIKSFMDYGVSKQLSIGLWADWYSPVYDDQKSFLKLAGFAQDVGISKKEDTDLYNWIMSGEKPIVATMGSGYFFNTKFVEIIREVSMKINKRFIIIVQEDSFEDSKMIIFRKHIDLYKILPYCSLFIHHGGAGSCTQAITTGTPSIVVHMAHDQPDNGYHIEHNFLGLSVQESKINANLLTEKILSISKDKRIQHAVHSSKEKCRQVDGIKKAVKILEEYVQ